MFVGIILVQNSYNMRVGTARVTGVRCDVGKSSVSFDLHNIVTFLIKLLRYSFSSFEYVFCIYGHFFVEDLEPPSKPARQ